MESVKVYIKPSRVIKVNILPNGEKNVQTDWDVADVASPAYLKNKPLILTPEQIEALLSSIPNGILFGGFVSWSGTGYIYDVSLVRVKFNNEDTPITFPATQITFDDGDATHDRFDLPYVDINGIGIKKGEALADPFVPQLEEGQYALTPILIKANTTEPPIADVPTEDVYQENLEYTITKLGTGTINADSTSTPFAGTKAIESTNVQNGYNVLADKGSDFTYTDFDTISFRIHLKAALNNNHNIILNLYDENDDKVVQGLQVQLNKSLSGLYQFVAVNINDFVGESSTARKIGIEFQRTGGASTHAGFFIDDWKLQGGISQPNPVTEFEVQDENGDVQFTTENFMRMAGVTFDPVNKVIHIQAAITPTEQQIIGDVVHITGVTGTQDLDLSLGAYFILELTGNTTLTFSNIPADDKTFVRTIEVRRAVEETVTLPVYVRPLDGGIDDPTKISLITVNCAKLGSTNTFCASFSTIEP